MKRYLNITLGIILLLAGCSGCNSKHQTESFDIQSDSITKIGSYSNAVPSKTFIRNLVFHTISDSTAEVLGEELFEGSPESITIPSKVRIGNKEYIVTQIGFNAFSNYENLKNVELPPTITSILKNAFYGCSSLVDVEIPSSVTFIGDQAFMGCESITDVKLPSNITEINNGVFCDCKGLTNFEIPPKVTDIGRGAFSQCSSLKNIDIPSNVRCILWEAFFGCDNLEPKILVYNNGTRCYGWIGDEEYCTDIEIPNGVLYIGDSAFKYNFHLKSVKIPSSVKSIGFEAFMGCNKLTHISIPSNVTSILPNAFSECVNLELVIDNSKDKIKIDDTAFNGCKSVKYLR